MPKVSVIIPCYNYARFLPTAVESVIGQTFRDFEIIIVDDGSTDNSLDVANELAEKYGRNIIQVISQENRGVAAARNSGISQSAGEFILPLDADDMLLPEYLENTVPVLDQNSGDGVAYSRLIIFGESIGNERLVKRNEYDLNVLKHVNNICGCSLFRRSLWQAVGGYDEKLPGSEDHDLWLSFAELGYGGTYIDKPLYRYRRHPMTRSMANDAVRESIRLRIKMKHTRLYFPLLTRISGFLGRTAVYVKFRIMSDINSFYRRVKARLTSVVTSG